MRQFMIKSGLVFILLVICSVSYGSSSDPTETEVKAAFVYNFLKFIEWPDEPRTDNDSNSGSTGFRDAPLNVLVVGNDSFRNEIQKVVKDRYVRGQPVVVMSSRQYRDPTDAKVVFLACDESKQMECILDALKGRAVLTIADSDNFAKRGGMIELYRKGDRIRFKVNVNVLKQTGLQASSRLLQLAEVIDNSD